ncbi:hypothetical protein G6F23_014486 [Rhizopus arrhizus]|nr:hypothetical protein G6F23_014486 [Rhizopus arrhizus]
MHAIQVAQAGIGIDVDVAADARRAFAQKGQRQGARMAGGVMASTGAPGTFVVDAVRQRRPDLVDVPGRFPVGLVQVGVPFDQARQQQGATAVLHQGISCAFDGRADVGDASGSHQHVHGIGGRHADILQ